jgi:pyrimidine deaminase RibD-like protein
MAIENYDLHFMNESITLAKQCKPVEERIPKVGAILAVQDKELGRGHRGTGRADDDDHAEKRAIKKISDKSILPEATLYTTLEPCTREVRSDPMKCCSELIVQHHVKRVVVGMLDPNQGVTGKGLLRLQVAGIDVALFPHTLFKQIRAINAHFIRSQQALGAKILAPTQGEVLRTYETEGRATVRFKSLNPPGPDTFLLIYRDGLCWPQGSTFRDAGNGVWEIDAHFGSTGDHVLQLVTANRLGRTLISYYQKVTQENVDRWRRLRDRVDPGLIGGNFPGIQMSGGLPKGIRLEGSVGVFIAYRVNITKATFEPKTISRGTSGTISYEIDSAENVAQRLWLGASFQDKTGQYRYNTKEDKNVSLKKGRHVYTRKFTIQKDWPVGQQMLGTSLWRGALSDSRTSKRLASGGAVPITIVE